MPPLVGSSLPGLQGHSLSFKTVVLICLCLSTVSFSFPISFRHFLSLSISFILFPSPPLARPISFSFFSLFLSSSSPPFLFRFYLPLIYSLPLFHAPLSVLVPKDAANPRAVLSSAVTTEPCGYSSSNERKQHGRKKSISQSHRPHFKCSTAPVATTPASAERGHFSHCGKPYKSVLQLGSPPSPVFHLFLLTTSSLSGSS